MINIYYFCQYYITFINMGQELVRNRFKIQQKIKRRSCGFQFICLDNEDQLTKILKLVPLESELIPNDLDLKRLTKQLSIYGNLRHINMFKIYTSFQAQYVYNQGRKNQIIANTLHIVLQKAKGIKLSTYIGKLSNIQALRVYNQVGAVIEYLHKSGVLHRDINPQNIYMDQKKLNFTVTFAQIPTKNPSHQPSVRKHYISPDVFQKKQYTARGDYWALGIVLLEIALGKRITDLRKDNPVKFAAFDLEFPNEQFLDEIYIVQLRDVIKRLLNRNEANCRFEYIEYKFAQQQRIWISNSINMIKQTQQLIVPNSQQQYVKYLEMVYQESLENLYLNDVNLQHLNILIYPNYVNLKKLNLSKNKIENLHDLTLVKFPVLIQLKLEQNNIKNIDPLENFNFPELKWLYMDCNKIESINILMKCKFNKLVILWLSSNKISSISCLLKVNLPQLEYLNLENNLISQQSIQKYLPSINSKLQKCQICFGCNF